MHILSREPSLITSDRKMGCVGSSLDCREDIERSCRRTNSETVNDTIACYNEQEIDSSHFIISKKLLGVGGFGLVRLAFKGTGDDKSRPYALKTMSKAAVLKRNSGIPAIMTELHALILLNNHPFICNAKYAFQDMSFLYLVLDLVPGGDMRYNIRQAPNNKFSESVAKFYIAQVLIAVDACHKSNILHRDVKPENILMGVDGYLKLSDFGVAKILPDIEDCRSTSGTHGYMAPEIYRPTHKHGTAADWFAVGITLHEFVCGRRPFESSRLQRFRASDQDALTTDFLNSRDDLSPVCKYFIQDLLHPQVSHRLGSNSGLREIQQHPWLDDVDWAALLRVSIPAPHLPPMNTCAGVDMKYEDAMRISNFLVPEAVPPEGQVLFKRYAYRNSITSRSKVLRAKGSPRFGRRKHNVPGSARSYRDLESSQAADEVCDVYELQQKEYTLSQYLADSNTFQRVVNGQVLGQELGLRHGVAVKADIGRGMMAAERRQGESESMRPNEHLLQTMPPAHGEILLGSSYGVNSPTRPPSGHASDGAESSALSQRHPTSPATTVCEHARLLSSKHVVTPGSTNLAQQALPASRPLGEPSLSSRNLFALEADANQRHNRASAVKFVSGSQESRSMYFVGGMVSSDTPSDSQGPTVARRHAHSALGSHYGYNHAVQGNIRGRSEEHSQQNLATSIRPSNAAPAKCTDHKEDAEERGFSADVSGGDLFPDGSARRSARQYAEGNMLAESKVILRSIPSPSSPFGNPASASYTAGGAGVVESKANVDERMNVDDATISSAYRHAAVRGRGMPAVAQEVEAAGVVEASGHIHKNVVSQVSAKGTPSAHVRASASRSTRERSALKRPISLNDFNRSSSSGSGSGVGDTTDIGRRDAHAKLLSNNGRRSRQQPPPSKVQYPYSAGGAYERGQEQGSQGLNSIMQKVSILREMEAAKAIDSRRVRPFLVGEALQRSSVRDRDLPASTNTYANAHAHAHVNAHDDYQA